MSGEDFEDVPRKKRKGKPLFSRKQTGLLLLVILIFAAGALFQHYVAEPWYGETVEQKYARCLTQKEVLDQRFDECSNQAKACEFQLGQCLGT